MKIMYIKLENFLGIYAGMNRTCIEIDFKNNKNKIIILNAGNGKGKTALLSVLHPLRESYDLRKEIIIPNENGHKIVKLIHNNNEYYIEHFYGKKNKSFISKNGIELNENGNITSFNEIAKDELGIDEEYFKIGRIGSNVSNFIDLKSTDRKKYITDFIPSIDEYLKGFDIIKNKYTVYNTQIKFIKNTIEKYSGLKEIDEIKAYTKQLLETYKDYQNKIVTLKSKIESFNTDCNKLIKSIVDYINQETEYEIDFNNFNEEINDITIDLDNDLNDVEKDMNLWLEKEKEFLDNNKIKITENILDYIKKLELKFIERKAHLKEIINTLNEDYKTSTNKIIEAQNKLKEYEDKLSNVNTGLTQDQIDNYKKELDNINKEIEFVKINIAELENKFEKIELEEIYNFYENNNFDNNFEKLINMIDNIRDENSIKDIEYYYTVNNINNEYNKLINIKKENLVKLKDIEKNINELSSKIAYVDEILPKRSSICNDDNCSFVKSAIEIKKNDLPVYEKLLKEKESIDKILKDTEEKIDLFERLIKINTSNKYIHDFINSSFPVFIIDKLNTKSLLKDNLSTLEEYLKIDSIKKLLNYKKSYNEMINYQKNLENTVNKYYISSSLINEYQEQIDSNKKIIESSNFYINELLTKIETNKLKLSDCEKRINICNNYYTIDNNINIYKNQYNEQLKHQKNLFNLLIDYKNFKKSNNIDILISNLNSFETSIQEIKSKLDENNTAITIIEDNMKKLSEIEKIFRDVLLIKDALDPKKGIPVVFANEFLKNIAVKTNNLLKIAYDDKFKIRFNITAKDFLIEVYKNDGTFLTDIKLASQGEASLTNLSLSLAMLENMIKNYNILYLDEVDCTLSSENRKKFIEMLDNQIDILNIEQCFVITHNNEFYDKNVDLILLEDHDCPLDDKDFMKGKNIIFKL